MLVLSLYIQNMLSNEVIFSNCLIMATKSYFHIAEPWQRNHIFTLLNSVFFFQLGKKCPFEKSENQFFGPKKINFDFNGLYLWTKTGLVTL